MASACRASSSTSRWMRICLSDSLALSRANASDASCCTSRSATSFVCANSCMRARSLPI